MFHALAAAGFFYYDGFGFVCLGGVVVFAVLISLLFRTSRRCTHCQELNRPEARYCAQCGQPLDASD